MSYVIYEISTTRLYTVRPSGKQSFASIGAAKSAMTRANLSTDAFAIVDSVTYFAKIEAQVERVNMMSGKKYMESINTPNYCSPSSEAYWSA